MTSLAKLTRYSLGVGAGVFILGLVSGWTLPEAASLAATCVAAGWLLWGIGALADDYARLGQFAADLVQGTFSLAFRSSAEEEEEVGEETPLQAPPRPFSAPPRLLTIHDRHGTRQMPLNPPGETPYRRLVTSFLIKGHVVGSFAFRDLQGRCLPDGTRIDFAVWRRMTSEPYLFVKTTHGTHLRYPVAQTLQKLAAGTPLVNEQVMYHPDQVTVLSPPA